MSPSFSSNDELVDYLVRQDRIRSDKVKEAFRQVDRRDFVPGEHASSAYADKPVPINGVTISAPHIVAEVTELLELEGDERVFEIGSGSGYQAAILGELAEDVIGVEVNEKLAEISREKVPENVEILEGNGFDVASGKFDRILFSCAIESFEETENFIKEDGIIVGPVKKGSKQILEKWKSGKISRHGNVRYVEMQD